MMTIANIEACCFADTARVALVPIVPVPLVSLVGVAIALVTGSSGEV